MLQFDATAGWLALVDAKQKTNEIPTQSSREHCKQGDNRVRSNRCQSFFFFFALYTETLFLIVILLLARFLSPWLVEAWLIRRPRPDQSITGRYIPLGNYGHHSS